MDEGGSWKKRFFMIWTGQAFSLFGSSLVDFGLIWWLTASTGSETTLAVSTLIKLLPVMLIGPLIGSAIDRWPRKSILIIADSLIALITLGLFLLFLNGQVRDSTVMIVLFLRSLGSVFHVPAMKATTTLLVPARHLSRIGGLNQVLSGIMNIVAPITGALLINFFAVEAVLLVDIVTAIIAVATLSAYKIPQQASAVRSASVLREMLSGFRYVRMHRSLLYVVMTCTLANIFLGPAQSFKSLLITKVFMGGALELSYLAGMIGAGTVLGGLVMSFWKGFRRDLITSGIGWIGVGFAYLVIGLLPGSAFIGLLIAAFAFSCFRAMGNAPLDAFYQKNIPPDKQGRVFSVLFMLDNLSVPFGLVLAAIIGSHLPIQIWFLLVGLSHAVLGISWMGSRAIRAAETAGPDYSI